MEKEGLNNWEKGISQVEHLVGHSFRDASLLVEALTHSSYSNEKQAEGLQIEDNERLEFLGDAVIGLVVAELLMETYPDACEGSLSRWRSALVSRTALAEISAGMGLGTAVRFGVGEKRTGGAEKRSILAGAFEAVVGALYKDAGLEVTRHFLERVFEPWVIKVGSEAVAVVHDNKTQLQEVVYLYFRQVPVYRLVESWGPEHSKTFRVCVLVEGLGEHFGEGRSKKEAEQRAAGLALEASQMVVKSLPGGVVSMEVSTEIYE